MYPYMPEQVMQKFTYLQIILRPPYESSTPTVRHNDLDDILDDFKSHMVLEKYRKGLAHV